MKELTLERVIAIDIIGSIRKCNNKRAMFGEQCIAEDDDNKAILSILYEYFFRQKKSGIDINSEEFLKMMFPNYFDEIRAAESGFYPDKDITNFYFK